MNDDATIKFFHWVCERLMNRATFLGKNMFFFTMPLHVTTDKKSDGVQIHIALIRLKTKVSES